jgi:hypothetical protein
MNYCYSEMFLEAEKYKLKGQKMRTELPMKESLLQKGGNYEGV